MRAFVDAVIALAFALLPRRRWDAFDLPIQNVVLASSLLTLLGGAAFGITGFFAYMAYVLEQREWTAPPMMIYVFVSYVIATPRGLFSLYLAVSGLLRSIGWLIDEPFGDPILTGLDACLTNALVTTRAIGACRTRTPRTYG